MDKDKIYITTTPGELFENIGKKIAKATPTGPKNQFIFQNSNDWIGYLFPLDEYTQGGYEGLPTFLPFSGEHVEAEILKFYEEIKNGINLYHY